MTESLEFDGPPQARFGEGALEAIFPLLDELRARRVLLVVDRGAYDASGAKARLSEGLAAYEVTVFDEIRPNPPLEDVERGIEAFRRSDPDVVVAIGGGSALDVAKAIGVCGVSPASARDLITGSAPIGMDGPPMFAVPTTAGTGSEATHFAVVYVDGKKRSFAHPFVRPEFAILDPSLTHGLPRSVTLPSGLDALSQALESIWSVGADAETEKVAEQAATRALANLAQALEGSDEARKEMMLAAHLAGRAIDVTKTTGPHAASYGLTSKYGVPHGLAVALTFAGFLRLNGSVDASNCNDPRGPDSVRDRVDDVVRLLGASNVDEAVERWDELLRRLGAPTRLREIGVVEGDLEGLVEGIDLVRLANHPRQISRDEALLLLKERL